MTGSIVLNGNLTSSACPLIQPETVTIRLARRLLCKGTNSKVFTSPVLFSIPLEPALAPIAVLPKVTKVVPPAPARNPAVPEIPIVESPAAIPPPITGANSPPLRPKIKAPPIVAIPTYMYLFLLDFAPLVFIKVSSSQF
ncbi:hypothetical protein WICPIJ_008313 [Wickerhamomyces pijperi]|uniref:Uncharacterized protein n=1 Tax=Wickerhamomyces pijperi TaxID=599730 RepID=A0A9P8Q018_WICPI|nr:hypothetical protein WICPIJ_008313 [Wickerhamomyces pijperi]